MVRLANEFPKDRIAVVGVIRQESAESALAWLEENGGVHYPWISDPGSTIARSYGVRGIPHMFLLDPEGRVVRSCTGCQLGSMNPGTIGTSP